MEAGGGGGESVYSIAVRRPAVARRDSLWHYLIHFGPELEIEIGPNTDAPVNRKYLCGDRASGTKTISAYVNRFYGAKFGYSGVREIRVVDGRLPYFVDK